MTSGTDKQTEGAPAPKRISGPGRVLASIAARLMHIWGNTLRVQAGPGSLDTLWSEDPATLFVLWHSRLFGVARIISVLRPERKLHVLVSASKDGAWLTAFFERFGLKVVRGSSSRRGREAVNDLIRVLRSGEDAGMTPDGPRGPAEVFKAGALVVARRSRVRVVLLGINYSSYWRANSWDGLFIPKPFSTVQISARAVPPHLLAKQDALEILQRNLCHMNSSDARIEAGVIL